jgi:hypothetical protein
MEYYGDLSCIVYIQKKDMHDVLTIIANISDFF